MEHNIESVSSEWIGIPEGIEVKVEHSDTEAEVPEDGVIEKIVRIKKDEDDTIFGVDQ